MRLLIVGDGKMGRAVASLAAGRGHQVATVNREENVGGRALTPESVRGHDVAIEFTRPDAAPANVERLIAALPAAEEAAREVDDAFEAVVDFESRALGTIEATRFAAGRKNAFSWEINGTKGSLAFDLERLNELHHSDGTKGFRTILVSEADHPFWEWWWPHGHMIGWEHSFVHEIHHLLTAIAGDGNVAPHGATFEDGYRVACLVDAVLESHRNGGAWTKVQAVEMVGGLI